MYRESTTRHHSPLTTEYISFQHIYKSYSERKKQRRCETKRESPRGLFFFSFLLLFFFFFCKTTQLECEIIALATGNETPPIKTRLGNHLANGMLHIQTVNQASSGRNRGGNYCSVALCFKEDAACRVSASLGTSCVVSLSLQLHSRALTTGMLVVIGMHAVSLLPFSEVEKKKWRMQGEVKGQHTVPTDPRRGSALHKSV